MISNVSANFLVEPPTKPDAKDDAQAENERSPPVFVRNGGLSQLFVND